MKAQFLLEKLKASSLVIKFPVLYETSMFITMFKWKKNKTMRSRTTAQFVNLIMETVTWGFYIPSCKINLYNDSYCQPFLSHDHHQMKVTIKLYKHH
jgi:hypothetical protein